MIKDKRLDKLCQEKITILKRVEAIDQELSSIRSSLLLKSNKEDEGKTIKRSKNTKKTGSRRRKK